MAKNYLEKLGLPGNSEKNEKNLKARVKHLEKGLKAGRWTGTLELKARERLQWFRRELEIVQEWGSLAAYRARDKAREKTKTHQKREKAPAKREIRRSKGESPAKTPAASARSKGSTRSPKMSKK